MFNTNTSADTKIAVLQERLTTYEIMLRKIDEAIQIMGTTSQTISKMLAVHEEKIEQCHKADDYITRVIEDLKIENREQHASVELRMDRMEEEVKEIGKVKWMTVGCGIVLTILAGAFSSLASGMWTPKGVSAHYQEIPKK